MPAASSRRRSARTNLPNIQDDIEEDASQPQSSGPSRSATQMDEDGDEVPSQPSRLKKVKKEKTKQSKKQAAEEPEPLGDPAPAFSPENFEDQPLLPEDSQKLNGLVLDWDSAINALKENALKMTSSIAIGLAEAASHDEEAQRELDKLDSVMRKLLDCKAELGANRDALKDMKNKMALKEDIAGAVGIYEDHVQSRMVEYAQKTSRKKYGKEDDYMTFMQNIWQVQRDKEPMPPVSELIPREDADESDDDDDEIQTGGVTQDFKCPLSLRVFENPLTTKNCGHSFSSVHIKEYLGSRRGVRMKCPASGCNAMISLDDLQPDPELAKKAKAYKRREEERQEAEREDVDEIIE